MLKTLMLVSNNCHTIAWSEMFGSYMLEMSHLDDPLVDIFLTLDGAIAWCDSHSPFKLKWMTQPNPYMPTA